MAYLYPRNPIQLADYLKKHPALNVQFPKLLKVWLFKDFDGTKLRFVDETSQDVYITVSSLALNKTHYYPDCFVRCVGNNYEAVYKYTGPKVNTSISNYNKSVDNWDKILNVFENLNTEVLLEKKKEVEKKSTLPSKEAVLSQAKLLPQPFEKDRLIATFTDFEYKKVKEVICALIIEGKLIVMNNGALRVLKEGEL